MWFTVYQTSISLTVRRVRKQAFLGSFDCVCCVYTQVHMSECLFVHICLHVTYTISSWEVNKWSRSKWTSEQEKGRGLAKKKWKTISSCQGSIFWTLSHYDKSDKSTPPEWSRPPFTPDNTFETPLKKIFLHHSPGFLKSNFRLHANILKGMFSTKFNGSPNDIDVYDQTDSTRS
jgi:hypothetical protein